MVAVTTDKETSSRRTKQMTWGVVLSGALAARES